jgi:hypothetical protein
MATSLASFVEPVRALLNDNDPAGIYMIESEEILSAMKLILNTGKVPGYAVSSADVAPDLTPADPRAYALLVFHTAKIFVNAMQRESFNTRAFSESIGEARELIAAVIDEVYRLEHGEMIG